jgi:hypothetical protein
LQRSADKHPCNGKLFPGQPLLTHLLSEGRSRIWSVSSPAKGRTFTMQPECGNLQDLLGSMATNSKFHFHTTKPPARCLIKHPRRLRGSIFSPQHTQNPSPDTLCLPQVRSHDIGVGIISSGESSQVLENFYSFQWFLVAHKNVLQGLLGMHGGRMLTLPLPPPLTQLGLMVALIEVLHQRLQSISITLW